MVAVAQVQVGQQRHLPDDETQRRVGDVEPGQAQVLHVAQLAAVIQLACREGGLSIEVNCKRVMETRGVNSWFCVLLF